MAASEKVECESPGDGIVTPRRMRPAAVSARPHHWRGPTSKPKRRSAMTAIRTTPPERTTWTTERGAREIAATCRSQPPAPTPMPIANHLEDHSDLAVRSGWRMSTGGASLHPRCLKKKPRLEAMAQRSARKMPSWRVTRRGRGVRAG
jgi:hypothetical protein